MKPRSMILEPPSSIPPAYPFYCFILSPIFLHHPKTPPQNVTADPYPCLPPLAPSPWRSEWGVPEDEQPSPITRCTVPVGSASRRSSPQTGPLQMHFGRAKRVRPDCE